MHWDTRTKSNYISDSGLCQMVDASAASTLILIGGDRITLKQYQASGLGIQLSENTEEAPPRNLFHGDQALVQDPSGTYDYLIDAQGNVLTDGSAAPGFADVLFGDATANQLYWRLAA